MEIKSGTKPCWLKIAITIVFVIIRAASPFHRAFHSASLSRLMRDPVAEFLLLFIEEGHQREVAAMTRSGSLPGIK